MTGALDHNPTERNFLSPNNFKFLLRRAPTLEFFVQKVNLPGVSSAPAIQASPFITRPMSGGPLEYDPLNVVFKVSENLSNYLEIYNWLHGSTHSTNLDEYGRLKYQASMSPKGLTSDIILTILNSSKEPNFDIIYHNAFPTALGEIEFNSDSDGVEYPVCTARFSYQLFELVNLKAATPDPNNILDQ